MQTAYSLNPGDQDACSLGNGFLEAYHKYTLLKNDIPAEKSRIFRIYEYLLENGLEPRKISTVLYTYLVSNAIDHITDENIEEQIRKPYSQFYLNLAHSISLGTTTFHTNLLDNGQDRDNADKRAIETYGPMALELARGFTAKRNVLVKTIINKA